MADGPSLGDFFAKKKKKNLKGTNLNNEAANPKVEEKKPKAKDKEENGWEEEEIVAPTMMVAVAGTLVREEDPADKVDTSTQAWGKKKEDRRDRELNDRKYPTLAKAMGASSNINIDDGSNPNINIKTSKNVFAALEGEDDDDDDEEGNSNKKRPKEIKPAMVSKVKGEFAKDAIKREVNKYSKKDEKKDKKKHQDDDDDEDEEEEEKKESKAVKRKAKKTTKVAEAEDEDEEKEDDENTADLRIEPDLEASKAKYAGRQKLPSVELPRKELEEEKKETKAPQPKGKKKRFMQEEEEDRPKLLVADW